MDDSAWGEQILVSSLRNKALREGKISPSAVRIMVTKTKSSSQFSVGIRFVFADDADEVIGELEVHARHLVARHVAGDTVAACLRTLRGASVTGQALVVVAGDATSAGLVGVMAIEAADPAIAFDPALTSLQAIGLESQILNSEAVSQRYVDEGAVAGATEVHEINRIHLAGVENGFETF